LGRNPRLAELSRCRSGSGGRFRGDRLLEAGFEVRRLNPLRVRLYAKSLGRNAKNDRINARVIARYAEAADTMPETLGPARERLVGLAPFVTTVAS
jgi:transposase